MAFDDQVPAILAMERESGSGRLSGWLRVQGAWFWDQACDVEDPGLRELYLGLRAAVHDWLFPASDPGPPPGDGSAELPLDRARALDILPPGTGELDGADTAPREDEPSAMADDAQEDPVEEPPRPPTAEEAAASALDAIWTELVYNEPSGYAAAIEDADPGPLELDEGAADRAGRHWERIHLACLRLPVAEAGRWHAAAWAAAVGSPEVDADVVASAEYLIPPLPVVGYPGVDTGYDPADVPEGDPADADIAHLLRILRQMSWLAEHDPATKAGFGIANTSSVLLPFTGDRLGIYRNYTDDMLKTPPERRGNRLIRLDELIRGVVPVPLPAPDSWWRSQVMESELALTSMLGDEVWLPQFGSPYKTLLDQGFVGGKPQDITVRAADAAGATPGTVAWVLVARFGGSRGRVIYVRSE